MQFLKVSISLLILVSVASTNLIAQEKINNNLLSKVITAYGGDALMTANQLSIREQYVGFNGGQNYSTSRMDATRYDAHLAIDFINKRKDFRWVRGERPDHSVRHWYFDGDIGYSIDHSERTMSQDSSMTFANVDRRVMYQSDLAVVRLASLKDTAIEQIKEQNWRGKNYHVVKMQPVGFPELILFFDTATHYLMRMDMGQNAANKRIFQYTGHMTKAGLSYAANTYVTRGGATEIVSTARSVEINHEVSANTFELPVDYEEGAKTLSFEEMRVQEVSDGVYFVGQDWGFSTIVDTGNYYIGVGGYHDISKRFEAVVQHTGKVMPLKYQLVTHHHRDHLGGMQELFEMGADFIVHPDHIDTIRSQIDGAVPDERFISYERVEPFLDEFLQIAYLSNAHAEHNLVAYIPDAKLLFTADMYFSRQAEGYSPHGKAFYDEISGLGFDMKTLASAHSGRLLKFDELEKLVKSESMTETRPTAMNCPINWVQCQ